MLSDDIKLPQVVDERSLDVRQLFIFLDFLIGLEEEIGAYEFVEDVIVNLLCVVHFFACLDCYPCDCEHKLKK